MATPVKQTPFPQEIYTPISSKTPYLQSLDERIAILTEELLKTEGCSLEDENKKTIFELINRKNQLVAELACCTHQRNMLFEQTSQLNQLLEESNKNIEKNRALLKNSDEIANAKANEHVKNVIKTGGVGFGIGSAVSIFCHFSPELSLLSTAVLTCSGVFFAKK